MARCLGVVLLAQLGKMLEWFDDVVIREVQIVREHLKGGR